MHAIFAALRQLRKSPGFAVTVILTIALGIGANTAIFTLVHAVLLRSLPVRDPHGLFEIGDNTRPGISDGFPDPDLDGAGDFAMFSNELYKHLKATTPQIAEVAAMSAPDLTMSVRQSNAAARAERVEYVSGNYFDLLGIGPFAGRVLRQGDNTPGAAPVAVLSYAAWQSIYAGDPNIVGQTLSVQGHPFTIIGVGPSGFFGDRIDPKPPALWIPLETEPLLTGAQSMLRTKSANWLNLLARFQPGTNVQALEAQMTANLQHWMADIPAYTENGAAAQIPRQHILIVPGGRGIQVLQSRREAGLYLLMGICLLVLLVACANVANLLLARGAAQRADTALRMALGAARSRVIGQMMTDSLVLACLGGAAGLAVAYGGTRLILSLAFPHAPQVPIDPHPSLPVLLFALGLSLATGAAFGIVPAWINSHADPAEALRGVNRSTRDRGSLSQKGLIVFQAALSLVLLVGAGLLTRSLDKLQHQDLGVNTRNRYLVQFDPQGAGYTLETLPVLYRDMEQRFGALPGVQNAAIAGYVPLSGRTDATSIFVSGRKSPVGNGNNFVLYDRVSPHYFAAIGQPFLAGRGISEQDTETTQPVAVVNQAFVRQFFPHENPIGRFFGHDEPQMAGSMRIVGVVADTKYANPQAQALPMYFLALPQQISGFTQATDRDDEARSMFVGTLILDFATPPANVDATVRRTLADINPNLTPGSITTFAYQVQGNFDEDRLLSRLTMLFGALALIVAAVGLYGITAYQVARRTSEIGVRMALGATRGDVLVMVLRVAYTQIGIGILIGLPVAVLGARAIRNQLYDTSVLDPLSQLKAVAALAAAATVAAIVPARRAASIEPVIALRAE
jgi:predicted permease